MICQRPDWAGHEDVVDRIPTVNCRFGLDIPGRRTVNLEIHLNTLHKLALPRHVVPVAVSKLLQSIKKLHHFLGGPVVVQGGEVPIVHEPVAVMGLVAPHLHPGSEALRAEDEVCLCALDPDQAGGVDVISTARALVLGAEVAPGHLDSPVLASAQRTMRTTPHYSENLS